MSTYRYDYSYEVSVDEVNKILKNNLQNIDLELTYTDQDTESGFMNRLDATMLPWQIIKGGQNSLLRFSIPLSKGKLSIEGLIPRDYDLTNVTILIVVTLGNPGYVSGVTILDPDNKLGTIGAGLLRHYIINALFSRVVQSFGRDAFWGIPMPDVNKVFSI